MAYSYYYSHEYDPLPCLNFVLGNDLKFKREVHSSKSSGLSAVHHESVCGVVSTALSVLVLALFLGSQQYRLPC